MLLDDRNRFTSLLSVDRGQWTNVMWAIKRNKANKQNLIYCSSTTKMANMQQADSTNLVFSLCKQGDCIKWNMPWRQ